MSTNDEHSAVARLGAKGLLQTKDGLRKERKNPSSSWFQHATPWTVQQRTRLTRWHPTWTEVWPMGWTAWTSTLTWTTLGEVVSWESVGKGRRTRVSLTSCQTERQWQAEQISPRKQHRFTLLSENSKHPNFRWTWNPTWKPSNRVKH